MTTFADHVAQGERGSFRDIAAALRMTVTGTQQANIPVADNDIAVTYTTNDPGITPDGAITIADGSTPTVDELLEFCEELNAAIAALDAKVNDLIAVFEAYGQTATS